MRNYFFQFLVRKEQTKVSIFDTSRISFIPHEFLPTIQVLQFPISRKAFVSLYIAHCGIRFVIWYLALSGHCPNEITLQGDCHS